MLLGTAAWVIVHFIPVLPEHRRNGHKALMKHGLRTLSRGETGTEGRLNDLPRLRRKSVAELERRPVQPKF